MVANVMSKSWTPHALLSKIAKCKFPQKEKATAAITVKNICTFMLATVLDLGSSRVVSNLAGKISVPNEAAT